MKRALVLLVGLLMTVPVAASAVPDRGRSVTVISYNIHHGAGTDGVLDLERIAAVIEQSGADVVGLQEVDRHWSERSNWVDQPAWFAKRLKMHYAYAANLDLPPLNPGEPRRQYGTAILSKFPIKSFQNTPLPLYPGSEQRGLAVATLKVRGAELRFANTHLTNINPPERLEQAQKVVELLGTPKRATLLVGDLNARPDTPEIKTLTDVLADAWTEVGAGPGHTSPADNATARIDYQLHSRQLRPTKASVPVSQASDHLPVVASFNLR
ncbi:metal-dependent hydrolase [Kribbella sandramycini]|uniref:Metal-dependent hydrolase n=1 Tax=Kribbella sandramycini TaxID=60450 RepID=A0A7Y4L388_9ACTN|nr:endonuclease/exonuclease/phosphatase family protein [Kribbella sandramycini]MBB6564961.1 endonuclease/exonuclease/phosphatase family metal-dependent hydrolase [Kribbella sandramycini]NOL42657.1 metal-dependent hydrolase [Kribbella sandramycini]